MPTVSIIVPCYNQAKYLGETLDSILGQLFTDWECVIVNDGSPDNTAEVAERYVRTDARFVYYEQNNQGLATSRNNGIKYSHGKYILPLDSDDLIAPTYLGEAVKYMDSHPNCKLVYCKARLFGAVDMDWALPEYSFESLLWTNSLFCSSIFRRDDYDKTNGYNPNMIYGYEDWDFWLSFLSPESEVHCLDQTLFFYRKKETSMLTNVVGERKLLMERQIFNNHRGLYDPYISQLISFHNRASFLQVQLDSITQSISFRIGRLIVKPWGAIRDAIKKTIIIGH